MALDARPATEHDTNCPDQRSWWQVPCSWFCVIPVPGPSWAIALMFLPVTSASLGVNPAAFIFALHYCHHHGNHIIYIHFSQKNANKHDPTTHGQTIDSNQHSEGTSLIILIKVHPVLQHSRPHFLRQRTLKGICLKATPTEGCIVLWCSWLYNGWPGWGWATHSRNIE